jgi:radical SAM protein with 4Fe4S-binding SPASM domain
MENAKIAEDIIFWPISQDHIAVFSAASGKVLCVPSDWQSFINPSCDLLNSFDEDTINLFMEYGIVKINGKNLNNSYAETRQDIRQNKKLNNLSLIISEGCNFKCPHCIHSNDILQLQTRSLNTFMSKDTAKLAVDKFFCLATSNNLVEIDIEFGAAEPLLNWSVIEYVVNYIKDNYPNFNVTYHMTTNLSLVTETQAKFFVRNSFKISTSLDGDKTANDTVRMDKRGNGTYEVIISKVNLMKENGYSFDSINLTLTKNNIDILNVEKYLDTIESMGMNGIGLDFDVVTSENLNVEKVCDKMLEIYDACKKRKLYCVGTWLSPAENMLNPDMAKPSLFCKAVAGNNISISPQGTLHMCNFTSTSLGDIERVDLYGEHLNNLIGSREEFVASHCQKCSLRSSCRGQCHTTLEVDETKKKGKIDFMCDFYRILTKAVVVRCLNEQIRNEKEVEFA